MSDTLVPGTLVLHPDKPEWGLGQVQSVIGERITVNFQHVGKVLINRARISLIAVEDSDATVTGSPGGRPGRNWP